MRFDFIDKMVMSVNYSYGHNDLFWQVWQQNSKHCGIPRKYVLDGSKYKQLQHIKPISLKPLLSPSLPLSVSPLLH